MHWCMNNVVIRGVYSINAACQVSLLLVAVDVVSLSCSDLHLINVIQQCQSSKEVHVTSLKVSLPTSSF